MYTRFVRLNKLSAEFRKTDFYEIDDDDIAAFRKSAQNGLTPEKVEEYTKILLHWKNAASLEDEKIAFVRELN